MDGNHLNARRAGLAAPERAPVVPAGLAPLLGSAASTPAGLGPPKVGAPQAEANGMERGNQNNQLFDYLVDSVGKQYTTLAALAARKRISSHALAQGSFLLCRWGISRAIPDLCVVASLLRQMGVIV